MKIISAILLGVWVWILYQWLVIDARMKEQKLKIPLISHLVKLIAVFFIFSIVVTLSGCGQGDGNWQKAYDEATLRCNGRGLGLNTVWFDTKRGVWFYECKSPLFLQEWTEPKQEIEK